MIVKYSPSFIKILKKVNVRVRNQFKRKVFIFSKNPADPQLRNHPLRGAYLGKRSIDITADWRAIYEEIYEGDDVVLYFIAIGIHRQLYK